MPPTRPPICTHSDTHSSASTLTHCDTHPPIQHSFTVADLHSKKNKFFPNNPNKLPYHCARMQLCCQHKHSFFKVHANSRPLKQGVGSSILPPLYKHVTKALKHPYHFKEIKWKIKGQKRKVFAISFPPHYTLAYTHTCIYVKIKTTFHLCSCSFPTQVLPSLCYVPGDSVST